MSFSWLELSNPVAIWWFFLISVATVNILAWFFTFKLFSERGEKAVKVIVWFSAAYVFGCAFRSFLPRADVQRICLFDTWFSSVFIGRTIATIAEVSFVAQWAIVLHRVSKMTHSPVAQNISKMIVPLIIIAECFSWYAVITTHYMGNTFEESIWAITYVLIAISLFTIFPKVKGSMKYAVGISIVGSILYIMFMVTVDVPMYFTRWQSDIQNGKTLLGFFEGLRDLNTRWIVTYSIEDWRTEIPWMSLYFSAAVWTSLALCYVPLNAHQFSKHLKH